ncbi:MAG: hypothetical protein AB7G11_07330 [Phycisphaerales bacterium]
MNAGTPTRVIAASMGLAAFSIATIAGLAADNPAESILMRAMISMFVCHALGMGLGIVGERAVKEGVERYVGRTPLPPSSTSK